MALTFANFFVGKYHSGKDNKGQRLGFKTIITPSKKKIEVHYDKIAEVISHHKAASQQTLIKQLNPIIRGWANYYSTVVSKKTYADLDNLMYQKLLAWAKRRHPNKSREKVVQKYWHTIDGDNWVFAAEKGESPPYRLLSHAHTPIVRHEKVKGKASPYDANLVYWSKRKGKHPEMPNRVAKLLKGQQGKCTYCNLYFREEDVMEIDHRIPKSKGGKDTYDNWQLLHRHCHNTKTASDGRPGMKESEEWLDANLR